MGSPLRTSRLLNVPGRYYTTEDCDGCGYCAIVAPGNFGFEKTEEKYYVARQPGTSAEEARLVDAMEDCPVDAILADGTVD